MLHYCLDNVKFSRFYLKKDLKKKYLERFMWRLIKDSQSKARVIFLFRVLVSTILVQTA